MAKKRDEPVFVSGIRRSSYLWLIAAWLCGGLVVVELLGKSFPDASMVFLSFAAATVLALHTGTYEFYHDWLRASRFGRKRIVRYSELESFRVGQGAAARWVYLTTKTGERIVVASNLKGSIPGLDSMTWLESRIAAAEP